MTWLELIIDKAGSHQFRVEATGALVARVQASLDGDVLTVAYYLADATEPTEVERYLVTPLDAPSGARASDRQELVGEWPEPNRCGCEVTPGQWCVRESDHPDPCWGPS